MRREATEADRTAFTSTTSSGNFLLPYMAYPASPLNVWFPSVSELIQSNNPAAIAQISGYIVSIKLLCWGIGGIIFGVVADRFGRARTLVATILIYSIFTGVSGLAQTWQQLAVLMA